ncbi:MAG: membrane protein insertase YidC, partial [Alphaproteobacteria bacterium]|nr:membrane protein insertase YidC [Alphaproteobacteria bacterium]
MDQKNLFVAIALSIAIVLGFHYLYDRPRVQQQQQQQQQQQAQTTPAAPTAPGANAPAPGAVPGTAPAASPAAARDRDQVIGETKRVKIDSPRLLGSIALTGGLVDDVVLKDYRETVEPDSPRIKLLSPPGTADAYYAEFGWTAAPGSDAPKLPDSSTVWTADRDVLTADKPVTLTWDNGAGLKFSRRYAIDANFMLTVTQKVDNAGGAAVTLFPYSLVSRAGTPQVLGFYILHEGLIGVFDGSLKEYTYKNMH